MRQDYKHKFKVLLSKKERQVGLPSPHAFGYSYTPSVATHSPLSLETTSSSHTSSPIISPSSMDLFPPLRQEAERAETVGSALLHSGE